MKVNLELSILLLLGVEQLLKNLDLKLNCMIEYQFPKGLHMEDLHLPFLIHLMSHHHIQIIQRIHFKAKNQKP